MDTTIQTKEDPVALVEEFVGRRDQAAFSTETRFEENRHQQYTEYNIYVNLARVVESAQQIPDLRISEDVRTCSWNDVLDIMELAREEYYEKGAPKRNPIRYAGRKLGEYARIISPALNMIPDELGVSILHGGLALIFSLARHKSENTRLILDTFDKVPRMIESLSENLKLHKTDTKLKVRAADFVNMLVDTMVELLELLLSKGLGKWLKAPFKGLPIEMKLAKLQEALDRFEDSAKYLIAQKVVESNNMSRNIEKQVTIVRRSTVNAEVGIRQVERHLVSVQDGIHSISEGVGKIAGIDIDIQEIKNQQMVFAQFQLAMGSDMETLLEQFQEFKLQHSQRQEEAAAAKAKAKANRAAKAKTQPQRPIVAPAITVSQFVEIMGVPLKEATKDLTVVSRKGQEFDAASIGQANSLLQVQAFTRWLSQPVSELILVDGHLEKSNSGSNKISAMSLFCAQFSQSILRSQAGLLLVYFCGRHSTDPDSIGGPVGMMRCLIMQLFLYLYDAKSLNLDAVAAVTDAESLADRDLDALCDTFRELVRQLPLDKSVFCIIDGISWFQEQWGNALEASVGCLFDIVKDEGISATFKVMLTSPIRLRRAFWFVAEEQHIRLSRSKTDGHLNLRRAMREAKKATAANTQWRSDIGGLGGVGGVASLNDGYSS